MQRSRRRDGLTSDLTPLIDVVFLLLIFFLVTSTFKKDELALLLQLPQAQDGKAVSQDMPRQVIIELTAKGLAMNKEKMEIATFTDRLKVIKDKTVPFVLRADAKVEYQRLIEVLEILQKYEIPNLSLVTDQNAKK